MSKPLLYISLLLTALMLTGCSTTTSTTQMAANLINKQAVNTIDQGNYPAKNPARVALYTQDKIPHTAYRIIGQARVSRYNFLGMQREDVTMHDMMKRLAASVGGDGLIDIQNNADSMQANVIAFQKILF
jgi:hypothetical protein